MSADDWEGSPRILDPDKIPYVMFTGIDNRLIPELVKVRTSLNMPQYS